MGGGARVVGFEVLNTSVLDVYACFIVFVNLVFCIMRSFEVCGFIVWYVLSADLVWFEAWPGF